MPVIKSAKKKLRQDKKRTLQNTKVEKTLKSLIKKAKTKKTEKNIISAVKAADKAAKIHVIHKNKAARIKSMFAHLMSQKPQRSSKIAK